MSILDTLTPDDLKVLMTTEDEVSVTVPKVFVQ